MIAKKSKKIRDKLREFLIKKVNLWIGDNKAILILALRFINLFET